MDNISHKYSELLVPLFHDIPKDVPFVATHVWPDQGAIHAGISHVVNAIPDNWPMGLHLSEGAIHVQEPGDSTFECRTADSLCEMIDTLTNDKKILTRMYDRIRRLKDFGVYNGGYEAVKLSM